MNDDLRHPWIQQCFSLVAEQVKNPPVTQETWVQFLGQKDPLEKETATLSSVLGSAMDREVRRATVHGVAKESDMTEQLSIQVLNRF